MKINRNFPGGGGRVQNKKPSVAGRPIFSGTAQCMSDQTDLEGYTKYWKDNCPAEQEKLLAPLSAHYQDAV